MLTLKEFFQQVPIVIVGFSDYYWDCYGPDAAIIDLSDDASIVLDLVTNQVYEIAIFDKMATKLDDDISHFLVWSDPDYITQFKDEGIRKGIKTRQHFVDNLDEMIKKLVEILNDE